MTKSKGNEEIETHCLTVSNIFVVKKIDTVDKKLTLLIAKEDDPNCPSKDRWQSQQAGLLPL